MEKRLTPSAKFNWIRCFLVAAVFIVSAKTVFSQSPSIVVDGTNVYVSEKTKYSFWVANPQTLAAGTNVVSISVLEYRITPSPAGENILQFVGPLKITTAQTVPAGKAWKVEAILLSPAVGMSNNGWTDDGTVVRLTTAADNVGIGNASPTQKLDVTGKLALSGKQAFDGGDTWLRLNQGSQFASGVSTPGFLRADGGIVSGGLGSLGGGTISGTGVINSNVGYQVSNGAATGNYLRGNGTNFVSSGIQAGDVPGGNGNYIQNQYGSAQSANKWISGESRVGSWFRNSNANTGLYNEATSRHFYSESNSYWTVADANGLIFRNSHAGTTTGYTYWDGTAGSNNFGLLSPGGSWRLRVDNSNTEAYGGFYASTSWIPYIYDRDNTGYYMDPNGNTNVSNFQTNNTLAGWPGYNGITQGYGHYIWPGRNDGSGAWWNQSWYLAAHSSYGLYTNTGIYIAGTSWVPYFYDANNTGYYLDMDGSSYFKYQGRNYGYNWTERDWNDGQYYLDLNNASIVSDLRSRIWYDYDNTGYNIDGNGGSNLNYATANDWYVNSWFRVNGGGGIYWQAYGGGWYMNDGSWIRSYNGKNVYCDAQIRADGGLVSGGIGTSGAGYINASRNIITNGSSGQGYLALTGDLPGYAINTYPTLKTNGTNIYFSVGGAYSSYISPGGGYSAVSSRSKKENFEVLDKQDILNRISQLEMYKWNYKFEDPNIKHIGPIAEDFWDKFRLNDNDCMVSHIDPAGVALTGVQALNENFKAAEEQIKTVRATLRDFGSVNVTSNEVWVSFNSNFTNSIDKNQLPLITITANKPGVAVYVAEKNSTGFKLVIDSKLTEGLMIDYVAMAHAKQLVTKQAEQHAGPDLSNIQPHHNQRMEAFLDPDNLSGKAEQKNVQQNVIDPVGGKPMSIQTSFDPAKFHEETKNKPAVVVDKAEVDKAGGWKDPAKLVPLHEKDPDSIETGPAKNPDEEKLRRDKEAAKKFLPVNEASPIKGEPNPSKEGAPK